MSSEPESAADPAVDPAAVVGRPKPHRRSRIRAGALIGVLTALLGFAIAVQVHANSGSDSLASLRSDDLIGILDNQNARADRLRQQIADLQQTLRRLSDSGDSANAARVQALQDQQALGILLGTIPATGPGITAAVADPGHRLGAEDVLDIIEELRGAGAEAISFGSVRVSTDTAFTNVDGSIAVDGTVLTAPYQVVAIGDPKTMDTALNIPGGIAATVRSLGGELTTTEQDVVTITVVRPLATPSYAKPSDH